MKIDTASAWWQLTLVVVAALLGVLGTVLYGWGTSSHRELTLYSNVARSDLNGPGIWPDAETKQISIHEFIIKNTGNVALDSFRLRLAPEGGDAAYDSELLQKLQFAGVGAGRAIPDDVKLSRSANAVLVDVKALQVGGEVTFTITNDGIATSYSPSILPTAIELKANETVGWGPVEFSDLSLTVRLIVIGMALMLATIWMYWIVQLFKFVRRKVQIDA